MVIMAGLAVVVAACSGSTSSPSAASSAAAPSVAAPSVAAPSTAPSAAAAEPVTIDWWHITTGEPGKTDFQTIADAYTAAHPNVKINITVLENEAFKTKLAATSPDAYPDLFQSWGGGTMAAQADAGLLKDITADVASWKDTINPGAMSIYPYKGNQYGIPWDMGMIGFWYNKDLFQRPASPHRPRRGTSSSPTSTSSRRPASPRSRSPARMSGRRCTCGRTSSSATAAARPSAR